VFRALGRLFRAFWYLITGRLDEARKALSKDPNVVRATYDSVIEEKKRRISTYKEAVATLIAQEEAKTAKIKQLTEESQKLERLKEGAMAKAKKAVEGLQYAGKSMAEIKHDEDYKRCLAAYQDFNSTLSEKTARIAELEGDVRGYQGTIGNHKVQLESLVREIDKLKSEAADAVADIIMAKEEKEIADVLSGIAQDTTSQELQEMRELRNLAKAEARVSQELAGTETAATEAEFLEYARTGANNDEFDMLIGLAKDADTAAPEAHERRETKLPEA